jgi:hypothetical membrane protein
MISQKKLRHLKAARIAGLIFLFSLIVAWSVIILSIHMTPWFDIYKNALSDMGTPDSPSRNIFNNGLIFTGIIALSLPIFASLSSRSRWGQASAGVFLLAVIHLILIGIYPEGTGPHYYVSVEFFVLKWIGALFYSIGLLSSGRKGIGALGTLLFFLFLSLAFLIHWPSIGLLEITSISLFTIWAFVTVPQALRI